MAKTEEEPPQDNELTNIDYISAAYYAICAVSEVTTFTAKDDDMRIGIMQKCTKIIDLCVTELYDSLFDPAADE
jgi:hypothetical protein